MKEKSVSQRLVVIGASAGGPATILSLIQDLPENTPGIVIVQHLCKGFAARMAAYLDERCVMAVKEARNGEMVLNGTVYLAGGDRHLKVVKRGNAYFLVYGGSSRINGVCPAVDVLFSSAVCAGADAMGVILTGFGKDGARGLLDMRRAGARTIVQTAGSCVSSSMPLEAKKLGAAEQELSLEEITGRIRLFSQRIKRLER